MCGLGLIFILFHFRCPHIAPIVIVSVPVRETRNGHTAPIELKWVQNECKMGANLLRNGCKRVAKWVQTWCGMGTKQVKNKSKLCAKWVKNE